MRDELETYPFRPQPSVLSPPPWNYPLRPHPSALIPGAGGASAPAGTL